MGKCKAKKEKKYENMEDDPEYKEFMDTAKKYGARDDLLR